MNEDLNFDKEVQRLHQLSVYGRWVLVLLSWTTLGTLGIWGLREDIRLWLDYFTWAAVRYAIAYNRLASMSLAFCIGLTVAVLVWQSRNILVGLSARERYRLEQQVKQIRATGSSHPLWKWVVRNSEF